jgi:uncharacterized membrane-anchored protein
MAEYEFSESENKQFLVFLQTMLLLSITLLVVGIVALIQGVIPDATWGDIILGLIFITMAIVIFIPIQYFLDIIISEGTDITSFMKGFTYLSHAMTVLMVTMAILWLTIIIGYISSLF